MNIPLFKPFVPEAAQQAMVKVLKSGWIGLGPEVEAFEKEFAEYIGCKYAIAVNSGTEALRLAMTYIKSMAWPRRCIITTPNTFVSTNHVIVQTGFTPVFADIDPNTGNLDINSVRRMFEKYFDSVVGIMVVHYGGLPIDTPSMSKEFGVHIIEDAAHACGSSFKGIKVGNLGQDTCFSFHAVKNLNLGDGGMITTQNDVFNQFCHKMRWLGIDKTTISRVTDKQYSWDYNVTDFGYKCHMNDITAAMGRVQLRRLDQYNAMRQVIDMLYRELLEGVSFLGQPQGIEDYWESSLHLMVIRSEKKEAIMKALIENDIGFGYHYKANYKYKIYERFPRDDCPGMEEFERTAISLPMHLSLDYEEISYICDIINRAVRR